MEPASTDILTPVRFRRFRDQLLITNEAGSYSFVPEDTIDRLLSGSLSQEQDRALRDLSILIAPDARWRLASLARTAREATRRAAHMAYLIIVPTLRCNLRCTYCQVSRAPLRAHGYDWGTTELDQFEHLLDTIDTDSIKIEFQGGEPTLRPDLIRKVVQMCRPRFNHTEFIICTNLTQIDDDLLELFDDPDIRLSTSIDGDLATMTANRTQSLEVSRTIQANLDLIRHRFGPGKVSALPTITDYQIDQPEDLVDLYVRLGFRSIFLRPVNYMGFARKAFAELSRSADRWDQFYERAIAHIIHVNRDTYVEEFYLSTLLRTIFTRSPSGFVDFRSPAHFYDDYCVIDFDGAIYPTDEARMLTRTGEVDLRIGSLAQGVDVQRLDTLNFNAVNQVDPDCTHCAYMPFCGTDLIDDLSRYGRIDTPRHDTWFCRRHMFLFDLIFDKVARWDQNWLDVFATWIARGDLELPTRVLFE